MSHQPIEMITAKIREVLSKYPGIHFVTIFGSAAHNRLSEQSDIDIAVAGDQILSYEARMDLYAALSRALCCEIDLVDLQSVNGLILKEALCNGEIVVNNSPAIYAFLLKKMWYNQADMMPYVKMILKKRCQRFVNG